MTMALKDSTNTTEAKGDASALPASPHAMVDAIVAEAVAERARLTQKHDENADRSSADNSIEKINEEKAYEGKTKDPETKLKDLIEMKGVDETEKQQEVTKILFDSIESFMQQGLTAFHAHESAARDLSMAKEEIETKTRELQRLRASEESSRTTIANLLRAVETAKSDARDASRQAQIEARLRSDLAMIRGERDEALGTVSSLKRKLASVEEDLRANRAKLGRVEQEKAKMERDSRAAISLAKTVGTETSCDIDYYKRKVSELQSQLSAQQALVAEQQGQISEMRYQQERSMSQNRLARADKSRKSY